MSVSALASSSQCLSPVASCSVSRPCTRIGVIVEVAGDAGLRLLTRRGAVGPQQSAVLGPQMLEHEVGGAGRRLDRLLVVQRLPGRRQAGDHLAVPRRQDLRVEERPRPFRPCVEQLLPQRRQPRLQLRLRQLQFLRPTPPATPAAPGCDTSPRNWLAVRAVDLLEQRRVVLVRQRGVDLLRRSRRRTGPPRRRRRRPGRSKSPLRRRSSRARRSRASAAARAR